jgi:hypothetical protein
MEEDENVELSCMSFTLSGAHFAVRYPWLQNLITCYKEKIIIWEFTGQIVI